MKAAFLSSSLISPKGAAGPAIRSKPPRDLVRQSKRAEAVFSKNGQSHTPMTPKRSPLQPPRAQELLKSEMPAEDLKQHSEKLKKDRLGRVRMSVRMTPEQHLHLKLISAHSHLSAQSIIELALNEYVDRHGADLIPGACACIRDKMFR